MPTKEMDNWLQVLGVPKETFMTAADAVSAGMMPALTGGATRVAKAIKVSPAELWLEPGESAAVRAERIYNTGPPDDLSSEKGEVLWTSSTVFFTVDKRGMVTAAGLSGAPKDALIIATDPSNRLEGYTTALVNVALPTMLRIEPAQLQLGANETSQLKAIRVFPGGKRTDDVSTKVTWTSSQAVVSVDAQGYVTAHGITGEMEVTISAADPDTPLTATVTIVVSASHDVALQITPPTVELAPGGSLQYKAERVSKTGRQDVTKGVDWESSSRILAIDNTGHAVADAKALQSETVDITATDRESDLTTKVIAFVKVPSREVRRFKLLDWEIAYYAGYADVALPRLKNAADTALAAEKLDDQLGAAYDAMLKHKDKLGPSLKNAAADVRRNGKGIKADAQSAKHDEFRKEDLEASMKALKEQLTDVRSHVVTAAGKLRNSSDTTRLHALLKDAKEFDEDIELAANATKVIGTMADPHAVTEKFTALVDLTATLTKRWFNSAAKEAEELQGKIDDENLRMARDELADAQQSAQEWMKLWNNTVDRLKENAKHATDHWNAVETKYDTSLQDKSGFQFKHAGAILKAAQAAMKAAKLTEDMANLAETSADDLIRFDPKPEIWLANPDREMDHLRTLSSDAGQKLSLARERQNVITDTLHEISETIHNARDVLLEPDPDEP